MQSLWWCNSKSSAQFWTQIKRQDSCLPCVAGLLFYAQVETDSLTRLSLCSSRVPGILTTLQRVFSCAQVFVTGSSKELGEWNSAEATPLSHEGGYNWQCMVIIPREDFPVSYKYILKSKSGTVTPEDSENRVLSVSSTTKKPSVMIIAADGSFRVCTAHL